MDQGCHEICKVLYRPKELLQHFFLSANKFPSIGLFEATLISLIVFFISTLFEIYLFKKVNEKVIYTFNIITYILITIGIFVFINQFAAIDLSIFILNIVVFLILQFYTLYGLAGTIL